MSEKRAVGRPSKYNANMQKLAEAYLLNHKELQGDLVPSKAGLCCYLGIGRNTADDWAKVFPNFSTTLQNIQTKQENLLINGGLGSTMNSTIVKLMMANHGYSDSNRVDHTTKGESIAPEVIERVIIDPKNADTNT